MKRAVEWVPAMVAFLTLRWQESCENPAVFCYRIGSGLLAEGRSRRSGEDSPARCLKLSKSFSGLSTTSRG